MVEPITTDENDATEYLASMVPSFEPSNDTLCKVIYGSRLRNSLSKLARWEIAAFWA